MLVRKIDCELFSAKGYDHYRMFSKILHCIINMGDQAEMIEM